MNWVGGSEGKVTAKWIKKVSFSIIAVQRKGYEVG